MTTSGTRLTRAVASAPTALPSPAVVCRLTSAGRPVTVAYPVAIPTTEPSCRARTKSRSSGRPVRKAISVEPGLAKIVVNPSRRKTSNVASRTVGTAAPSVSSAEVVGFVLGERQRLVGRRVAVHERDAHGADRGDDGEDVEAPRVGQAQREQPATDQRAGDRARPADTARRAHCGTARRRRVD